MKIGEVLTGVVGEEEILRVAARGLIKVGHPRPANGQTTRLPDNFDKCCTLGCRAGVDTDSARKPVLFSWPKIERGDLEFI